MKNILVVGSLGQLGSEIAIGLRRKYGSDNVVLTDIRDDVNLDLVQGGPFYKMDSRDGEKLLEVAQPMSKNEYGRYLIALANKAIR